MVMPMKDDVDIVQQRVQDEFDKGTRWAGIAMVLVWGPLLAMHIMGVF